MSRRLKVPAPDNPYRTRNETDFFSVLYNPIRAYTIKINNVLFPGYVMIGDGYIFLNITNDLKRLERDGETPNSCIDIMRISSSSKTYEDFVLYVNSYYDSENLNTQCHEFYKTHGITHTMMFNLFDIFANQIGVKRIELYDGSSYKLPQCKWNLRILNRILNPEKSTFYEKFGFTAYNEKVAKKLDSLRLSTLPPLSPFTLEYIRKNKLNMKRDKSTLQALIEHMYDKCENPHIPFPEYEEIKNDILRIIDVPAEDGTEYDLYYKDIEDRHITYTGNMNTFELNFTISPRGGKKIRKTKKLLNKMVRRNR
jgi:hypothetical protein